MMEAGVVTLIEELRAAIELRPGTADGDVNRTHVDVEYGLLRRAIDEIEQLQGIIIVHTAPQTGTQSGGACFGFGNTKGACPTCGKWF